MNTRSIARSLLILAVLFTLCTGTAVAGGWAVITLDDLPAQITAGQMLTLGFTVRQHGKTLRDDLQPALHFARADINESFSVTAKRQGPSGHYSVDVTFPSAGQWNWRVDIEQFGMITQDMPALMVSAAAGVPASASASSATAPSALPVVAGVLGLIGAGAGLVLWWRTRLWWMLALTGVAIAIGLGSLIAASSNAAAATARAQPNQADLADRGKALFEAKGCVMCHTNAAVKAGAGPFYFGDTPAPNLTHVALSAEYLRQWLKDPSALKPDTAMPNLNLKAEEIEALIAFLKSDQ
jgi:cytochrome c2